MVTKGKGKAKPRVRRSAKLKALEQKGAEILGKGGVVEAGPSLYLASSESEGYRDVRHVGGLWYCDCPYFTSGHTACRHICAVRMMILMRDGVRKIGHTTDVDVVKIHCPSCKSTDCHESTTYATRIGRSIVYRCRNPECGGGLPSGLASKRDGTATTPLPMRLLMPDQGTLPHALQSG